MRYSLVELAAAAGLSPHVVRHHIRRGLVPWAHGHADSAYYDENHLHRLLAVKTLRARRVKLKDLGGVLQAADAAEIRRLAGIPEPPAPPEPAPSPVPAPDGPALWQRVPLAPGVELHVRIDLAGDVLTRVQAFQKTWSHATG